MLKYKQFSQLTKKFYSNTGVNKILSGTILSTSYNNESTTITFLTADMTKDKPFTVSFNNLFLRDSSMSKRSVDEVSGQKLFTLGQLLKDQNHTTPEFMEITPDGKFVSIKWKDGDHYNYPLEFFYKYKGSTFVTRSLRNQSSRHRPALWDSRKIHDVKQDTNFNFNNYLNDDSCLYESLASLQKYGLIQINNIPKGDMNAVKHIVERIGPIRKTIYGEIFEINNSKPSNSNIAYSDKQLPLHMDLQYLENVPGFQLLHSVKNELEGGENTFVDAFNSTRAIRELDSEAYEALNLVPINYHYKKGGHRYYQSRPLIEQFDSNEHNVEIGNYEYLIKHVNWSPMFQAPLTYGIYNKTERETTTTPGKLIERITFRDFVRGIEMFEDSINNPDNQYTLKLPENSCVIFNNRRILHSRGEIKPTQDKSLQRIFRGCYLDTDHFRGKLKYLEEQYS